MSARRAAALALGAALQLAVVGGAHAAPAASDRAQILFEQSETAYREGRFDEAISLLKEAYRLTPDPVVFYNLARAYEGKGDLEQAASAYERYLAEGKDIPDRGALEKKIETLKKLAAERKAAETAKSKSEEPKPVVPAKETKPANKSSPSPVPWVIAGFGGAGTIAGAIVAGLGFAKNEDADAASSQRETADLRASAEDMALAGNITMGVGGAILLAGTIWGIVDVVKSGKSTPAERATVRVRVGAGSVSFSIGFD